MSKTKIRLLIAASGVLLAVLALAITAGMSSASIEAVTINGTTSLPGGGLPAPNGTWAWLMNPDRSVHGQSQVVTGTGAFSFAGVTPGAYLVRVVPPAASPYAPSNIMPVFVLTSNITLPPLPLTSPSITGTVYAPDGITPANAMVHVHLGPFLLEDRPTVNGNFALGGLPAGVYVLQAEPLPDAPYWESRRVTATVTPSSTQFVSLTLASVQLAGVVKDGPNPVEGARVHAVTLSGAHHQSDVTGPLGKFAIGDLPSLGLTVVAVEPPPDRGGLLPAVVTTTLPTLNLTITLGTSNKIVHGSVKTNTNISVTNALVEAQRVDALGREHTLTDASGVYTLHLSPGVWAVSVHPISVTVPRDWVNPNPARLVQFDDNLLPERKTIDFMVLTADATVNGAVQLPGGITPPFTVTVALHNDEGIGVSQPIDAQGQFSFMVPHGVYNIDLRIGSPLYAEPPLPPTHARPLTTTIVPTITLLPRDAFITGTLTDGVHPAASVPVIAWSPRTHATFGTRSNSNGAYVMHVYSGTWLVRPAPLPDQPYVYTGDPQEVTIASDQITTNVNFTLTPADATIHGVLVDGNGAPVPAAQGFATAANGAGVRNGAPIESGEFDILVPAGTYTLTLHMPGGQRYMWDGSPAAATVASGDTTTVTMTLIQKNALIRGVAYNARTDVSVDVDGRVWAWDNGLWTGTDLKPGGFYTLPVPAGLWRVNYDIDPDSDFVKAAGPRSYGIQAGQTQIVNLPALRKDGTLSGTVVLTDGVTPARGAIVIAEGISPELNNITLRAPVRDDGHFSMQLPAGLYNVRSARIPDRGLINPAEHAVFVPRNGVATVTLQYRQPDAIITGTVTLTSGGPLTSVVSLYAWSDDDGYNMTLASLNGAYHLPVIAGRLWHVVAVFETRSQYWITHTVVPVPTPGAYNKDLMLAGPNLKPAPVTVLLDPTQDRSIELSDGTRIFIPAGALPATGRVILHITPLASVPHHRNGDVVGLSYAFEAYTEDGEPITDNFNEDVIITFKYNPLELIARGLTINRLKPAYFSTTTNSWTLPDSYVVDEDRHEITMQINHFTQFSLLGIEGVNNLYLPIVIR